MFSSLGLFQTLQCPDKLNCTRTQCIFSHRTDLPPPRQTQILLDGPSITANATARNLSSASQAAHRPRNLAAVGMKRAVPSTPPRAGTSESPIEEPPRKLQKLNTAKRPIVVPSASYTSAGVPVLKVNAALSKVAVPVRQAMVKNLFDHFVVLYDAILPTNPTLASEHALRQEDEVYNKSNKITYRNVRCAVITSIASLKKRPKPDSPSHQSVGTEGDLRNRTNSRKSLDSLHLTRAHLDSLIMSLEEMRKWGYVVDIPDGDGSDKPSKEGSVAKCERCAQPFKVKRSEEAEECLYHWGKPYLTPVNGEKMRVYSCCSKPTSGDDGCVRGPHVFYESKPEELHSRHAFSCTRPYIASVDDTADTALDVVALDCEMIYTTAGMSVARVSVVDGSGNAVFDQFVRPDNGVEVIDLNTRFSGITTENLATGLLPLTAIRASLDALINSNTIIVGHALDNDLKTLRMIHQKCVDTSILFPHKAGPPYRRSLRDLVRENMGILIQAGGGTVGHSSVEDSIATLDLVRWYVLSGPKRKIQQPKTAGSSAEHVMDLT